MQMRGKVSTAPPTRESRNPRASEECYEKLGQIRKENWIDIYRKLSEEFQGLDPYTVWELRDSTLINVFRALF